MKKIFTICALLLAIFTSVSAQQYAERVIVHKTDNTYAGFLAERVDSISFPTIEGRVAADIVINSLDMDEETMNISVTRSEVCESFKLALITEADYNWYNVGDYLATYIDRSTTNQYYQDFPEAILSGITLTPGANYYLATLGFDKFNIPCSVSTVAFSTPAAEIEGTPAVETTVVSTGLKEFTLHFVPNEDCAEYSYVAGETGSIQSQYNMFAAWMGFTCFGDLVWSWGIHEKEESEYTYTDMNPNTEYEVFVQPKDINGNYGECETITVSTQAQGGTGEAKVEVTLGEYGITDGWWDSEAGAYVSKPSQFITFTPNSEASCYRYIVALASAYDNDAEGFNSDVTSEPPMPSMVGWFQYDPLTTDFQINPEVEYVIITAAKNANGEWGPVQVERHTTPSLDGVASPAQTKVSTRKIKNQKVVVNPNTGMVPAMMNNAKIGGLKLTAK